MNFKTKYDWKVYHQMQQYSQSQSEIDPTTIILVVRVLAMIATLFFKWYGHKPNIIKEIQSFKHFGLMKKYILWRKIRKNVKDHKTAKLLFNASLELIYSFRKEDEIKKFFEAKCEG